MNFDVRSAGTWGALESLEPVAIRIYGEGDRAEGWFRRKLHRDCVDPDLSVVAVDARSQRVVGYILVGAPEAMHPVARTAGVGTIPQARGHGVATTMLHEVARRLGVRGFQGFEVLAAPDRVSFFADRGLVVRSAHATMLGWGRARETALFSASLPSDSVSYWSAWLNMGDDAWDRTPATDRTELTALCGPSTLMRLRASSEGRALLVQRLDLSQDEEPGLVADALEAVRARVDAATPVLLHGCDIRRTEFIESLLTRDWSVVQRFSVMRRQL